eukprot:c10598_g1_i2.p1 GENE.c10598_g1_i2~~c10598_g1_i2.p1  ORF type:complete len:132 (-),score=29.68 c10598_g1_i2:157-552(-)
MAHQMQADLLVLLRLMVLVVILMQGEGRNHLLWISFATFVCFLYLTGRLDFMWRQVPVDLTAWVLRLQRPDALLTTPQPAVRQLREPNGPTPAEPGRARQVMRHIGLTAAAFVLTLNPNWDPVAAQHPQDQ